MTRRHLAGRIALALGAVLVLIQLVPYGHSHANPSVSRPPHWDSAATARLVDGACNDCHSNLTHWRWYSNVAPASWLVQNDVNGGRNELNFSRWDQQQPDVSEVVAAIRSGAMPPIQYKLAHPAARLSKADRERLARGIQATYAKDPPGGG